MPKLTTLPSPSAQLSYLVCPSYTPSDEETSDAERGTLLHKACEMDNPLLADNKNDQYLVSLAIRQRDMWLRRIVEANPEVWGETPRTYRERKLPSVDGEEAGGTIDFLALPGLDTEFTEAAILDYKFGYNPVAPCDGNPQVLAYVTRVLEKWPSIMRVHATIILPGLRATTSYTFEREEVAAKYQAVKMALSVPATEADGEIEGLHGFVPTSQFEWPEDDPIRVDLLIECHSGRTRSSLDIMANKGSADIWKSNGVNVLFIRETSPDLPPPPIRAYKDVPSDAYVFDEDCFKTKKDAAVQHPDTDFVLWGTRAASAPGDLGFHPGHACTYCALKAHCPALQSGFVTALVEENQVDLPRVWNIAGADENTLSSYRSMAGMMADFADTVKKAVDEEAKTRELVLPGYRWVKRKNDPVVKNPNSILHLVLSKTFVNGEAVPYAPIIDLLVPPDKETMKERDFHQAVRLTGAMIHPTKKIPDIENVPGILETHAAYRAALEERPDTRYQAKAPRRGYLELLEDAMELHRPVPPPTSEEEAEECLDPSTLTEDTTDTTDTTDTPDTTDQN